VIRVLRPSPPYAPLPLQVRAIKKLKVLGGGFDVVTIGAVQVRALPAGRGC
jgi:hypothetical protein